MEICSLNDCSLSGQWDAYIQAHPQGTFCHLLGWKLSVEKIFQHRSYYFIAKENKKIVGVLPLFYIARNIFSGPSLISIPFATSGGILSDTQEIGCALLEHAKKLAQELNVDYLELRNLYKNSFENLISSDLYISFIRSLPSDPNEVLEMLPRKARAATRNAIKKNLSADFEPDNIKDFYQLFSENKRFLGSPSMPECFFLELRKQFSSSSTILFIRFEKKLLTAVMTFEFKDTLIAYYSGATLDHTQYNANNFMYYKLMQYGSEKGYHFFDFGRSRKDTGASDFKKNQGFEAKELPYQYYLVQAKDVPHINPSNPKFHLFQKIWKKLPLRVTQILGSQLVKYLP